MFDNIKFVTQNGLVFFQETYSSLKDYKQWEDKFKGKLFPFHNKTNSCGIAKGYYIDSSLELLRMENDKAECILMIEVKVKYKRILLINL